MNENLKIFLYSIVVLSMIPLAMLYRHLNKMSDCEKLKSSKAKTKTIVEEFEYPFDSRSPFIRYNFQVEGQKYRGSYNPPNPYTGMEDRFDIGDTIEIVYYTKDPSINYKVDKFRDICDLNKGSN
jgi:hypothetical protein